MSNLNIFKIGVGPSSSHTLGPMLAGNLFCKKIEKLLENIARIEIVLYGSLSLTGKGHLTDKAILWGLNDLKAKNLSPDLQEAVIKQVFENKKLNLCGKKELDFDYEKDLIFSKDFLPLHENALKISVFDANDERIYREVYYSVGGGFVKTEAELEKE